MEILSVIEIWKYFKWVPSFILKRLFTKQRLADLVFIDVMPRYQSVQVNLGDVASYDIYLQVINMSPFSIELDRAEIVFSCAGTQLKSQYIKKEEYASGRIGALYISGDIESAKADQIVRHYDRNDSYLDLHIEFNCKLHNFQKTRHNLNGVNTKFINASWRVEKQKNA